MYSDTVRRLVAELPNSGELPAATHRAETCNPVCGDSLQLQLQVVDGVVVRACFRASGCPAALAGAAGLTQLVTGRPTTEALAIEVGELLAHLDGLPPHKVHGAEMAVDALRRALLGETP